MDDLHLQADLFFGPCNDPDCPGAKLAHATTRLELVWPQRWRERPLDDPDPGLDGR